MDVACTAYCSPKKKRSEQRETRKKREKEGKEEKIKKALIREKRKQISRIGGPNVS